MNIKLLKAFSEINNGIILNEGKPMITISAASNLLAVSKEDSTVSFNIFDLKDFLSVLSLTSNERKLDVSNNIMTITDGKTKMRYIGGSENAIISPPKDVSKLTDANYINKFEFPVEEFKRLMDASSIMKAKKLVFDFSGEGVTISTESDYTDSNSFTCSYPVEFDEDKRVKLDVTTMRIPTDTYAVSVGPKAMRFESETSTYYVVLAV